MTMNGLGNHPMTTLLATGLVLGSLAAAAAQETNTSTRTDSSSTPFQLIAERNIFNAHRLARRAYTPPAESRPAPKVDVLALVGILSYEKGPHAFFDGSNSDYRKVLRPRDTIAGCTIADIQPQAVKLQAADKTLELRVGMQLRREENGPWQLSSQTESFVSSGTPPRSDDRSGRDDWFGRDGRRDDRSGRDGRRDDRSGRDSRSGSTPSQAASTTTAGSAPTQSASTDTTGTAPSQDANEVLRRLIEQREKQLR